ncbi:MAG: hypothetical protein DRP87_19175, partial [Spirochaetes bacterium]
MLYTSERMESGQFLLLLNESIKEHILKLGIKEKKRLKEKLEFLENGLWDSGLVVKKLKGVSAKVVFEARLSRGERLIFTLGRSGSATAVYIWGIVKHDDISRAGRNIFPQNAPFLQFEPEYTNELKEIILEESSRDYFTQESIEEKTPEDSGPQKWFIVTEKEWARIFRNSGTDNFETFLYLTSKQSEVLNTKPPLLISGTAGSGKTTIAVYYLLRKEFLNKRKLFLTYSPFLKRFSEKLYRGLVRLSEYDGTTTCPDFYVFRDLLFEITVKHNRYIDPSKEVRLTEFERIFNNHPLSKKYDSELVWEEIRSIIKGAKPSLSVQRFRILYESFKKGEISTRELAELKEYLFGLKSFEIIYKVESLIRKKSNYTSFDEFVHDIDARPHPDRDMQVFILNQIENILNKSVKKLDSPLLTLKEYLQLGKKRAPNFIFNREELYSIAEYYQEKLEKSGMYDEIDLCKMALGCAENAGDVPQYDLVVCDEVQDFSDIQMDLIFRLAADYRNIVFTGDIKQIINPSGFRWEEVKNRFYERGIEVPDLYNLNLNFRCVGNIVRLSNALLDLKGDLIGLGSGEYREDWKFGGRPPFLFYGIEEEEMLEKVHLSGAGQIIIVRDRKEQNRLKSKLETELVFTINEAKGLEFDTVCLWKFAAERKSADIWRKMLKGQHFPREHYPHIRHEINLLYVALTRARNTLIIYDGKEPSPIWDMDQLKEHVHRSPEAEMLTQVWNRISSPHEWDKQGHYFMEREYYSAAVECFKNAADTVMKEIAEAYLKRQKRDYRAAAQLFRKHGRDREAAECFEAGELFREALEIWKKKENRMRALVCSIRMHEAEKNYRKAAEGYMELGDRKSALECWEKAGDFKKIADYMFKE